MREILFRGFHENANGKEKAFYGEKWHNGEWVYGNLFVSENDEHEICIGTPMIRINYRIDISTVGQYTGLTDMNGKKIFEGDILKVRSEDYDYEHITSVYNSCNVICVDVVGQDYDSTAIGFAEDIWSEECCDVVVIGNIYENHKLLKDGTQQ